MGPTIRAPDKSPSRWWFRADTAKPGAALPRLMPSRTAVGWALLFSVPPAVGVTGYASIVIGRGTVDPMAIAAGGLTFGVVFALVLGSQLTGSPEEPTVRERVD